ncbi:hypothetical protein CYMTET_34408, partial [Cymbomonas tetramitiformis]
AFSIWSFNCIAFLVVRSYDGFEFNDISVGLRFLDSHRGVFRWHICYNMVVLKMISFGMDLHWRRTGQRTSAGSSAPMLSYKQRSEDSSPDDAFSWLMYFCYLFYPPLYLAGPTISFNAFVSYRATPQNTYTWRGIALYGLRLAGSCLAIEILTHTVYANAIAKSGRWKAAGLSSAEVGIAGWLVLNFMWLKFLIIWRFFRLWALIDGVEPPENMQRCVNNNYDIEGFWKNWHVSYNRWLVRYLYIPLGGARRRLLNMWPTFIFVAMWHDLDPKLLGWAVICCTFAIPALMKAACGGGPALPQPSVESRSLHAPCTRASTLDARDGQ